MSMNCVVGLVLLAVGITLLILGFNESNSFGSDVSRFFTGNPTDRSMWFLVGGIVAVIAGLALTLLRGFKRQ
jgi:multisubunit Na+/H+ antiporter MnhB subunit